MQKSFLFMFPHYFQLIRFVSFRFVFLYFVFVLFSWINYFYNHLVSYLKISLRRVNDRHAPVGLFSRDSSIQFCFVLFCFVLYPIAIVFVVILFAEHATLCFNSRLEMPSRAHYSLNKIAVIPLRLGCLRKSSNKKWNIY